jgi:Tol biopolymer transport system component
MAALVGITVLIAAVFAYWLTRPFVPPTSPPRIIPLTSLPGQKDYPAFSPDGNQVAFTWDGGTSGGRDIYVKLLDVGKPLQLTSSPGDESSPAWSPDGRLLAFLRPSEKVVGIYLVPALGGAERKLTEVHQGMMWFGPMLDWSPDRKFLAVPATRSPQGSPGIFLVSLEDGTKRRLTSPSAEHLGDSTPRFSPDGETLAFVRGASGFAADLYLVPVAGGEPRRLTSENRWVFGLAWTRDSREVVFASNRTGLFSLWKVSASGGTPEALPAGGEDALSPSISRQGNRLAYVRGKTDSNIWRTVGPTSAERDSPPARLISTTREEIDPDFSPDGKRIAFASDRSGNWEIWTCDSQGLNPVPLTSLGTLSGTPRWSPDGQRIAFNSTAAGSFDIYVMSAEGGPLHRVTTEISQDLGPSWSRDGRWVYFASNRGGTYQTWKVPAEGGQPVQVTKQEGGQAFESPDGKFVYYLKSGGVWRVPAEGGEEVRILDQVDWNCWAVVQGGICFLNRRAVPHPTIELFNFADGKTAKISTIQNEPSTGGPWGFAVSPDGQWVLYERVDQVDNDIMLVENFR